MQQSEFMLRWPIHIFINFLIFLIITFHTYPALAQNDEQVQVIEGRIEPNEITLYRLTDLQQGQRLYVYLKASSGNLDPIVGLLESHTNLEEFEAAYESTLDQAITESSDPFEAIDAVRDHYTLAWDDDSGGGLTAALEFEIPADGDYHLLIAGALSLMGFGTFGDYRLSIGIDAPQVLSGDAKPTGDILAVLDEVATPPGIGVQEITGNLSEDNRSTFAIINRMKAGDTFYAYIEATTGDLAPTLILHNFADKPIRSANLTGEQPNTTLQYTFPVDSENYRLAISSCCEDRLTSGEYRLLVGVNQPQVLEGQADIDGRKVIREPIEVKTGIKLEQMIEVNQQNEFFTAVAGLQMEWRDPALAFNPESCQCDFQTYSDNSLANFISEKQPNWPKFSIQNQQGNRWIQNQELVVFSDGRANYYERFTTNFQVDFDFRKFPFDTQQFVIRIDSFFPEEYYRYTDLEDFSAISSEHGEDEFILSGFETQISSERNSPGPATSRFTFLFGGPRHLSYYIFQIFVPILLIILVSWITFFLRDYTRRIEVASANLLLFIAFSFSLADNYPRLGYLTFLDAIMAIMFVINALVVVYNVWLRRMEMNGEGEKANRIDSVLDWAYPLTYIASLAIVIWYFF